jgi:hypothetical protein
MESNNGIPSIAIRHLTNLILFELDISQIGKIRLSVNKPKILFRIPQIVFYI